MQLYLALPETPNRVNRLDGRLAEEFSEKGVTEEDLERHAYGHRSAFGKKSQNVAAGPDQIIALFFARAE